MDTSWESRWLFLLNIALTYRIVMNSSIWRRNTNWNSIYLH